MKGIISTIVVVLMLSIAFHLVFVERQCADVYKPESEGMYVEGWYKMCLDRKTYPAAGGSFGKHLAPTGIEIKYLPFWHEDVGSFSLTRYE